MEGSHLKILVWLLLIAKILSCGKDFSFAFIMPYQRADLQHFFRFEPIKFQPPNRSVSNILHIEIL